MDASRRIVEDGDDEVGRSRLVRTSADALLRAAAPPMRWIVRACVCEELTTLATLR